MRHVLRDAVVQAQIDKTNEAIQLVIGLQGTRRLCDLAKNMGAAAAAAGMSEKDQAAEREMAHPRPQRSGA